MKMHRLKESGLARRWTAVKRAFTLVELLVVIAITALLLGMLIPALAKARENAKSTVCRTRLKQLGMAVLLYAENNNNEFVTQDYRIKEDRRESGDYAHNGYWYARLAKYIQGVKGTKGVGAFMRCPSGQAIKDYGDEISFTHYASDYALMSWVKGQYNTTTADGTSLIRIPNKMVDMPQPAHFATIFDFYYGEKSIGGTVSGVAGGVYYTMWKIIKCDPRWSKKAFRHNSSINSAFGDGHVEHIWRKPPEWRDLDPERQQPDDCSL